MMRGFQSVESKVFVLILAIIFMSQCSSQSASSVKLPTDIRGIQLDMSKEDAHKRLNKIATFLQEVKKRQEVWLFKDDPNFSHIMVGYDKEGKVRYVTTTLETKWEKQKKRLSFSEIGNLSKAKKESVANINKYFWDVEGNGKIPTHQVYVYGDNDTYLLHFSLSKRINKEEEEHEKEGEE